MVTRRVFLKNGAFALVSLGFAPSFLARTAFAAGDPRRARQLIAIFQRGAVDGLSMVVPCGEAEYYRARPTIAIPRPNAGEGALDLDGFFGFNPRLGPLKPLWDRRDLAIVHACGSPDSTRSHFDAQDYMETATPGVKSTGDGWLNRYLQARRPENTTAFRAVALGPQLPRVLQGTAPAIAVNRISEFGIHSEKLGASFEAQYAGRGRSRAERHWPRSVRRHQDAEGCRSVEVPPGPRGRVSTQSVRAGIEADRTADEGGYRSRGGVRRHRRMGHTRQPGRGPGAACREARRLRAQRGGACDRPGRTHGGYRRVDHVRVRTCGGGKRQSRHRSRSRERDDGHRRRRARRDASTVNGRVWRSIADTRGAIWRSRPIFATCSARSSCATSASPIRGQSFRDIRCRPRGSRAYLRRHSHDTTKTRRTRRIMYGAVHFVSRRSRRQFMVDRSLRRRFSVT